MKILFMGTPEFARKSLEAIYESGEEIVGVVTTPHKVRGSGSTPSPTEVKKFALEKGLDVYQPQTLKDGAFQDVLDKLTPDLIVVVAYGRILPEYVINYPKYGCINSHASILPKYRGAAPIQRAIIDGESETGVSVMQMDAGLDTGDVILVEKVTIEQDDDFEAVHDKLVVASQKGLLSAIDQFKNGTVTRTKQGENFTYAEKITKEDCFVDFNKSANETLNQIRGLCPVPMSFTKQGGKILKIVKAHASDKVSNNAKIGQVVALDSAIHVKCADKCIALDIVVPEGKGRMNAKDLINGRKISLDEILG
jgi:methionyl-tRNA formyltransferase